jgi:dephospho-CoA kinase
VVGGVRVGLTGGIGAGKSAVARLFSDWGAFVIDADVLARDVVSPGTPGLAQIARRWPTVITATGELDRAALSRIVFSDAAEREELGAIVHPRVRDAAARLEATAPVGTLVVHVVPLLFEGDYWRTCDATVVVIAPKALRVARVVARDGAHPADVDARMAAQIDPERAATLADFVLTNDGDLSLLERQAREVFIALGRRSRA